jgi:NADPH-dependent 2,4-dienoyl-CoA reductase/sulfur reductase-like enzyme/rhodanese-related sulfurtransferase
MRYVIIGGLAAGTSAAAKARRVNEKADIVLIERSNWISQATCGFPYFLCGEVRREDLQVMRAESFARRFKIDLKLNTEAISLDPSSKTVKVLNARGEYELEYDKLVIATGARPSTPEIEGKDLENVFTMRYIDDVLKVKEAMKEAEKVSIIGAGMIGLECAEAFLKAGMEVSIIEIFPEILPTFDEEMAYLVRRYLEEKGIEIYTSEKVFALEGKERVEKVITDKREIPSDLVLLATGVKPNVELVSPFVKLGVTGAIEVDEHMRTSVEDIYAAGDCVETVNLITKRKVYNPVATLANKQGRVAGANIAGRSLRFPGTIGTAIAKVFDLNIARTGLSEKEAREAGFDIVVSYLHPYSHATYYPHSERMSIKLIVEKNSERILGAQIVGKRGVDKRIDVLSTAIIAGMKAEDLFNLDLAYSPPFSSAKDPVNVAGAVVDNILKGEVQTITPKELAERLSKGDSPFLLDVRSEKEVKKGRIRGAINIPLDELDKRLGEIPRDREIICYCATGLRSYIACRKLVQKGFKDVKNLSGSWESWIYEEFIEK